MSDKLFDEFVFNGKPYTKGDWKAIAQHDEKNVKGFFGDFTFLSNFYNCSVFYDGLVFPSSEHAYMFNKIDPFSIKENESSDWKEYIEISNMTCRQVKKWGSKVELRKDWEQIKLSVMSKIVFDKFSRNSELLAKLLSTGDKYLEETNWWGDSYWGVDLKKGGQNNLGKILMRVRQFWKDTIFYSEKSLPKCEDFSEKRNEFRFEEL